MQLFAQFDLINAFNEQGQDGGNTTINAVLPYWFLARLPDAYHRRRSGD